METQRSQTRQEILTLLKNTGEMTVSELRHALGISAMGIRQHLALLERDGLVQAGKRRGQPGRPAHHYTLTPTGHEIFPRHYDHLALTLLEALGRLDGEEKIDLLFRQRMEKMLEGYRGRLAGKDLAERVQELAGIQQENGYMAEYGADPNGYYLIQHNCTMARVAERFPVACRYERNLFETVLGAPIRQDRCMARGDTCCAYFVATGKARRATTRTTTSPSS